MGKIHKLSPALADMIAAGEVVERPASVIKELVENAIDAGAKKLTIEIQNGGITYMRVTDDGCGMSAQDAATAFLRHATSKISSAEDLNAIMTMGFRGEALAAISAVSKIDLLTKVPEEELGTSVRVEAGNVLDASPAGCPQGTTIIVRDLFYNTPARMKFLKRDSVEGSYIAGAVQRQALSHPEIAFRFIREGKQELSTPGDGKLQSAIYAAMGRQYAKEMVEIQGKSQGVAVTGFVGKPTANRGSRSYQHFFVNGRYVKSRLLSAALEEAYKNQMMVGRFPIGVVHIQVPPTAVDVNIHPAKTEVKFLREGDVFDAVHYTVLGALSRTPDRPEVRLPEQKAAPKPDFYQTMPAQEYRAQGASKAPKEPENIPELSRKFLETLSEQAERAPSAALLHDSASMVPGLQGSEPISPAAVMGIGREAPAVSNPAAPLPEPEQTKMALPELPKPVMPESIPAAPQKTEDQPEYRIIGQTMDTYIIIEQGDNLFLMDKHAAHERVLFEKLKGQTHEIMSQMLLRPLTARLSRDELAVLLEHDAELSALGFTVEDAGTGDLLVRAIPCDVAEEDAAACLSQLAQNFQEGVRLSPETVHDNLLHTIACKAAIKGGRKTDPMELSALVAEVMSRDDIKYCPHGRPVCITLTRASLERQFKRS